MSPQIAVFGNPPDEDAMRADALDAIRRLDQALAPGSETELLGYAVRDLENAGDPGELRHTLAWWRGAYRYYEWAIGYGVEDEAVERIVESGDDLSDWTEAREYARLRRMRPVQDAELMSERVYALEYQHEEDGENYRHDFGPGVEMWALDDGTVLLRHPRKLLWGEF